MYAVFRSGGKQYRASKGERLRLEKLDVDEGSSVKFDEVLLLGEGTKIKVGSPLHAASNTINGRNRLPPLVTMYSDTCDTSATSLRRLSRIK